MKKLFGSLLALGFLVACNNQQAPAPPVDEKKPADSTVAETKPAPKIDYPFVAKYSSDWKLGDPNNSKLVLDFYKALEDGKFDQLQNYFADSVGFRFYDTRAGKLDRAEAIKRIVAFRAKYKTLKEEFYAFVPLHSNDRNEDWVSTWVKERAVSLNGKSDSTTYQENWILRDGKIAYVEGFAQYKFRY